jgi:hypothetical protein
MHGSRIISLVPQGTTVPYTGSRLAATNDYENQSPCYPLTYILKSPVAAVITTPRILTWSFCHTVSPLMVNGMESTRLAFLVKCMIAVFSASNVAPLRRSQSRALSIIAWNPPRLHWADRPVTHAV